MYQGRCGDRYLRCPPLIHQPYMEQGRRCGFDPHTCGCRWRIEGGMGGREDELRKACVDTLGGRPWVEGHVTTMRVP